MPTLRGSRVGIVVAGLALLASLGGSNAVLADKPGDYYICHATGAEGHWVTNNPNDSGDANGHMGMSHQGGRDIIPPIEYNGQMISQNWNAEGQAIHANGCEAPDSTEPAGTEPTGTEPTGTEPTGTEPTSTEPTGTEPTGTEPTGTEPTGTEPTGTEPIGTEPTGTEPTGTEPVETEPAGTEPAKTAEPTDPAKTPGPVTNLPETGDGASGKGQDSTVFLTGGLLAAGVLFALGFKLSRRAE